MVRKHRLRGGLAVDIFFVISGYLITRSAAKRGLVDFSIARSLRILPGLFFAVVFTILVGAAFTSFTQSEYWTHQATWDYLRNSYLFPIRFLLPGVFSNNPNIGVNGSLWTLPIEAAMYLISAILLVFCVRSRRVFLGIAALFGVAYFIGQWHFGLSWENRGSEILPSVPLFNFLGMGYFFFAGAALSKMSLPPNRTFAFLALVAFLASAWFTKGELLYYLILPYLVYFAAFVKIPGWVHPNTDLSYGIYLYAFPVQQGIVQLFEADITPLSLTLIATPITVFLGFLSWHFIEQRALNLSKTVEMRFVKRGGRMLWRTAIELKAECGERNS